MTPPETKVLHLPATPDSLEAFTEDNCLIASLLVADIHCKTRRPNSLVYMAVLVLLSAVQVVNDP